MRSYGRLMYEEVDAMVAAMKRNGLVRLSIETESTRYELELPPFTMVMAEPQSVADLVKTLRDSAKGDTCSCGHSMAVEHNDFGCLQGCSTELCASTDTEPGKPQPN